MHRLLLSQAFVGRHFRYFGVFLRLYEDLIDGFTQFNGISIVTKWASTLKRGVAA